MVLTVMTAGESAIRLRASFAVAACVQRVRVPAESQVRCNLSGAFGCLAMTHAETMDRAVPRLTCLAAILYTLQARLWSLGSAIDRIVKML